MMGNVPAASPQLLRPNRVPWPPLLTLGLIGASIAAQGLVPLPWVAGTPAIVLAVLGLLGVCAALGLDLGAVLAMRRHRTTFLPHRGAAALVTEGPFARSRNPIYVGNVLLTAGLGLMLGNPWLLVGACVLAVALQRLAILREEAHLAAKFGAAWEDYRARVPRWFGPLRR
jgi:protein-S-isoprenylcysteine O-methyltransferase Ste14